MYIVNIEKSREMCSDGQKCNFLDETAQYCEHTRSTAISLDCIIYCHVDVYYRVKGAASNCKLAAS